MGSNPLLLFPVHEALSTALRRPRYLALPCLDLQHHTPGAYTASQSHTTHTLAHHHQSASILGTRSSRPIQPPLPALTGSTLDPPVTDVPALSGKLTCFMALSATGFHLHASHGNGAIVDKLFCQSREPATRCSSSASFGGHWPWCEPPGAFRQS
jgi:hypothetical protein